MLWWEIVSIQFSEELCAHAICLLVQLYTVYCMEARSACSCFGVSIAFAHVSYKGISFSDDHYLPTLTILTMPISTLLHTLYIPTQMMWATCGRLCSCWSMPDLTAPTLSSCCYWWNCMATSGLQSASLCSFNHSTSSTCRWTLWGEKNNIVIL